MEPTHEELARLLPVALSGPDNQIGRDAALRLYLFLPVTVNGVNCRSSLEALLRDARGTVGRDPASGMVVHPDHSRSWLGAMGYLSLVDQISKLLDVPSGSNAPRGASTFERLLMWDGYVLSDEAAALYALRCSFVHNYGLLNKPPPQTKPDRARALTHMFALSADGQELVRLGSRDFAPDTPVGELPETSVDLRSFEDMCERLIADLRSRHLAHEGLHIRSSIPLHEFTRACFFFHADPVTPMK